MAEVKNRRVTMIKPTVGKVKTSAYALPDGDFVYGIESKLDMEGAGDGETCSFASPYHFLHDTSFRLIQYTMHHLNSQWYNLGLNLNP